MPFVASFPLLASPEPGPAVSISGGVIFCPRPQGGNRDAHAVGST